VPSASENHLLASLSRDLAILDEIQHPFYLVSLSGGEMKEMPDIVVEVMLL